MWPYQWTHVGTPSHSGHLDWVAATLPSQSPAGAAKGAPELGHWEVQDVTLVRPSSCIVKEGIQSSQRYLPTYLFVSVWKNMVRQPHPFVIPFQVSGIQVVW